MLVVVLVLDQILQLQHFRDMAELVAAETVPQAQAIQEVLILAVEVVVEITTAALAVTVVRELL
jgi:hypothetical protein